MTYNKPKLISPSNGGVDISSAVMSALGKSKTFV